MPQNTEGNIFRLKDGSVMVTMVSAWRHLRKAHGYHENLPLVCRVADAAELANVSVTSIDLNETVRVEPRRDGDTIRISVPKHGKATVIVLSKRPL